MIPDCAKPKWLKCPVTHDGRYHAPAARSMAAFQLSSTSIWGSGSPAARAPVLAAFLHLLGQSATQGGVKGYGVL